jgi:hypothetical protein
MMLCPLEPARRVRRSRVPIVMSFIHVLEGAPSFAPFAKGGLLRSKATTPLLFPIRFVFSANSVLSVSSA